MAGIWVWRRMEMVLREARAEAGALGRRGGLVWCLEPELKAMPCLGVTVGRLHLHATSMATSDQGPAASHTALPYSSTEA